MKNLFASLILLLLASCATMTDISKISPTSNVSIIPPKSDKIIVTTNNSDDDNFNLCMKKLIEFDYEITTKDKENGYILAEKKSEFDTYVKLNISVSSGKVNIKPSWKAGAQSEAIATAISGLYGIKSGWESAKWYKNSSKASVAFLEADKLALTFSGKIEYQHPVENETEYPEEKADQKSFDPIYH